MTTVYDLTSLPAADLRAGDRVLHPDLGVFTLADRPLRLRGPGVDQQWVTLRFVDAPEIEVHEGDWFDRIDGEVTR